MKRILCMFVAIMIVFTTLLSACSKNDNGNENNNSQKQNDNSNTKSGDNDKENDNDKEDNNSSSEDEMVEYSLPLENQKTLSIMTSDSYNGETLPLTACWQAIEEATNIKIDWNLIESSNYNEVATTRLAAGVDLADIVKLPGMDSDMKYQKSGMFVALNPYIEKYGVEMKRLFEERPDMKAQLSNPDGEIFFFTDRYMPSTVQRHLMFNQEWLDEVQMDIPTTTDEFYDLLIAFRDNDPNKNGEKDEIPFSAMDLSCLHNALSPSFGVDVDAGFLVTKDQSVECSLISPKLKDYLAYLNKLYEEDLLDKEFPGKTFALLSGNVGADKIGAIASWSWHQMTFTNTVNETKGYDGLANEGIWIGEMPLEGPNGDQFMVKRPEFGGSPFGITKDCEDKELAYIFMDYNYSDEKITLQNWGVEGVHTEVVDGVRVFTEEAKNDPELERVSGRGQGPMLWQDEETTYARIPDWHRAIDLNLQQYFIPSFPIVYAYEEEVKTLNKFNSDMKTYSDEMLLRFILGEEDLDRFDKYVDTLKDMGIEEVIEVKQAQYKRYLDNLN